MAKESQKKITREEKYFEINENKNTKHSTP